MFNNLNHLPLVDILKYIFGELPFIVKDCTNTVCETYSLLSFYQNDEIQNYILAESRNIKLKLLIDNLNYDDLNIYEKDILDYTEYLSLDKNSIDTSTIFYFEKKINWNVLTYDIKHRYDLPPDIIMKQILQVLSKKIIDLFISDVILYTNANKKYYKKEYNKKDIISLLNLLDDKYNTDNKYIIVPIKVKYEYFEILEYIKKNNTCPIYYIECDIDKIIVCNYKPTVYYKTLQYMNNYEYDFTIKNYVEIGITYPNIMPFLDFILF